MIALFKGQDDRLYQPTTCPVNNNKFKLPLLMLKFRCKYI